MEEVLAAVCWVGMFKMCSTVWSVSKVSLVPYRFLAHPMEIWRARGFFAVLVRVAMVVV